MQTTENDPSSLILVTSLVYDIPYEGGDEVWQYVEVECEVYWDI